VQQPGAVPSVPRRQDVDALLSDVVPFDPLAPRPT
jgi:hypothetical protein